MFPGDQENVAKALAREFSGFAPDFLEAESDAENGVVARETAIFTIVDALVGKIERREKADDLAKTLLSEALRAAAEYFEVRTGGFGEKQRKISEVRRVLSENSSNGLAGGQAGLVRQMGDG